MGYVNISKGNGRFHKRQTFLLCGRTKPLREVPNMGSLCLADMLMFDA